MISEGGSGEYNDLIDVVIQSSQKQVQVVDDNNMIVEELKLDPMTLWWKTGSVNSNTFARFAFELMEFKRVAISAMQCMCAEHANAFALEINTIVESFMRSVDAKSSESQHNKENSRSTLIDKINRKSIEKVYTSKGKEAGRSLADIFMGKDKANDREDD